MEKKISDELIELNTKLMMVQERSEALKLANEFNILIERIIENEHKGDAIHTEPVTVSIEFTKKEISRMATAFKKIFVANGLVAHVLKRKRGSSTSYEIRYRSNGYNITASATTIEEAKQRFLEKTEPKNIEKYFFATANKKKDRLVDIFEEFCRYKTGLIAPKTITNYKNVFGKFPEALKKSEISLIRTVEIDEYFKTLTPREYEDARIVCNSLYKYAIASGIVTHNPVTLIPFKRAERTNRDCLSRKEVSAFFEAIKAPKYDKIRQGVFLIYYFGLRPCEIDDEPRREGNFLIARNRKRKGGKVEYKKIPISKEAEAAIDWDKPLKFNVSHNPRTRLVRELLNGYTAYNLRHTFCSICRETVREDIVDVWMGDSSERLIGRVYTHFSDEFMMEQMETVKF